MNVTLQYPGESLEEVPRAAAAARQLAAAIEAEHGAGRAWSVAVNVTV